MAVALDPSHTPTGRRICCVFKMFSRDFVMRKKYEKYQDMVTSDLANRDLINSTGLDEAMRHLSLESLRNMLAD